MSEAIHRAVEAARPFIDERRHELELSLATDAKIYVNADPTRLEQIITNLLTNAIKYTRKGGEIRIELLQEGGEAVIRVMDTGIGIAPRMLPHIFELFTQGDRSLDRSTSGLGIGLNLCHQLVGLHGGTIRAASDGVGRGSTFTVRLPTITVPEPIMLPQPSTPRESHGRQRRILLVDDNQDTVVSLARLLSLRGHEVATAFDGVAALKLAQEFQPDFLLLDIGLPGLDGYEVARRLRAEGFALTPIVAISGYAQEGDRIRSRESGLQLSLRQARRFRSPRGLDPRGSDFAGVESSVILSEVEGTPVAPLAVIVGEATGQCGVSCSPSPGRRTTSDRLW
ncbi:MAG: ATP-binding protein [Chthoniobacter sp.]